MCILHSLKKLPVPGSSMPEARHSMTRRRASPAPRGLLQVAIAFSQISSKGCKNTRIRECNMQPQTNKQKKLSTCTQLLLGQHQYGCDCLAARKQTRSCKEARNKERKHMFISGCYRKRHARPFNSSQHKYNKFSVLSLLMRLILYGKPRTMNPQ